MQASKRHRSLREGQTRFPTEPTQLLHTFCSN